MNSNVNSPLRYPGGKSALTEYFSQFIIYNSIESPIYAEPYCGGAGAAVNLLLSNRVDKIILNDADISIYSFWYCIKNLGDEFIQLFEQTTINLDEWSKQKEIFEQSKKGQVDDFLKLGFSTFYLNRCNRSGILTAGPIGGKSRESQLNANYKIDARFNRGNLREKLLNLIKLSKKIEIYNLDALAFLKNVINNQSKAEQNNTFVYLDPPYYSQGSSLYLNYYKQGDHEDLRKFLEQETNIFKWLLSYDNVKAIKDLYHEFNIYTFYINYSAQQNKLGSELLIQSKNSIIPETKIIKTLKNKKQIELNELV